MRKMILVALVSIPLIGCIFSPAKAQTSNVVQFSASNFGVQEDCTTVTLIVNRVGDTSGAASVDYNTSNVSATERKDYITALGKLQFAAGETSKSFVVLINEDSFVEGTETFNVNLTNPIGATLGTPVIASVTITDDVAEPATNVIDDPQNYVCQHYHDFLNRQPDQSGWDFWTSQITSCGSDQACIEVRRISVSASFFLSIEFQQTGYLVERSYKTAYGDDPGSSTFGGMHQLTVPTVRLYEFLYDTQQIIRGVIVLQPGWEQQLENNKQAFFRELVQRSSFVTALPTSMTPTQFVDQLNQNAGNVLSASERTTAINLFGGAGNTTNTTARAQALRLVVEDQDLQRAEFNRAFVLMQYFGYLRRNPNDPQDSDHTGYDFWLTKLNAFNGNYIAAEMVKAFITSLEYRGRFGPFATPAPTPTPTPTPGQGLTPEQRVAALDAVSAQFEALINSNPDRNAVSQALLDFIRSRPEFAESGISEDSCVWATYIDGVELVVVNNRALPAAATASTTVSSSSVSSILEPQAKLANLPSSDQASVFFALGPGWADPTGDIRSWLNAHGYAAFPGTATVEALKTVGRDGVFYYNGHGGTSGGTEPYSLGTRTVITPEMDRALVDDLDTLPDTIGGKIRPRLRHMVAIDDIAGSKLKSARHYAFTAEFIRYYWKNFSPNSFVYIDTCRSASPAATLFRDAIREKGASVYAGWTSPVGGPVSAETAKLVFDRLLGANKVYLEDDFQQRPFDYLSVEDDLPQHKAGNIPLGHDTDYASQLVFLPFQGTFTLLAPSIAQMRVDEDTGELILTGIFGDDPGSSNDGKVTVNGQDIGYTAWTKDEIRCKGLPDTGPNSSGDVIVWVRNHKSNVAQLTEWEGDFVLSLKTDVGTHEQRLTVRARFRADARKWRQEIHKPPVEPNPFFTATRDSHLDYTCSGSSTYSSGGITETVTWIGAGRLPRFQEGMTDNFTLPKGGLVTSQRMNLQFPYLAGFACTDITTHSVAGTIQNNLPLLNIPLYLYYPPDLTQTTKLDLDGSYAILPAPTSNSRLIIDQFPFFVAGDDDPDGIVKLTWNRIEAKHPPAPNSPR